MRTFILPILLLITLFVKSIPLFSQLIPGDIAFVQYNSDLTDNFAIVALVNIPANEIISFTDNEENDLNGLEGTIIWTSPEDGVNCGTIIIITTSPSTTIGSVSESGDLNFAMDGDSILAYQGSSNSPSFIAALSNDGGSWGGAADGNLPTGLTNGVNAIAINPEIDNCAYGISNNNDTHSNLLSDINNNSNWTLGDNANHQTFPGSFIITDCDISGPTSSPTDYFRSKSTGPANWGSASSWESSDDGTDWMDATLFPDGDASGVVIQANHTILMNAAGIEITNTQVFGTLELVTDEIYDVIGDEEIEFIIENGGNFIVNNADSFPTGNAWGLVKTGGTVTAGTNAHTAYFLHDYVSTITGLFYFEDASICDWQQNAYPSSNATNYNVAELFYPYPDDSGAMPIFRISSIPTTGGYGNNNNHNTIYAILELNTTIPFHFQNERNKTIVGGIRSTPSVLASVTQTASGGTLILGTNSSHDFYPSYVPELSGSVTFSLRSAGLRLDNGADVSEFAEIVFSSLDNSENSSVNRAGGNLNINGNLDITNMRITNSDAGGIFVNDGGTLRTRNSGGLFGDGSAIVSDSNFTLNDESTIDYYATQNQTISSGKAYYHLIFSGSGTKNPGGQTDVHTNGSITITGTPIVDYSDNNLGLTEINDIDFYMESGRLIIGTGGSQPRPGGAYSITGGEIEFTGNSNTSIRVLPDYYNIRISGTDKEPGAKGFTITNFLTVTSLGELTIPSSTDTELPYVLNALNGITVEPNGILQLENNAVLLQNPGVTNSGNIIQIREAIVPSDQYNFWASPVSNQNLYDLYPDIPANRVMVYDTETDYYDIIPYNPTNPPQFEFGVGYSIKGPSSNAPANPDPGATTDVRATFVGTPHNESLLNSENQISLSTIGQGFNLIGNPFPSNLDLKLLHDFAANSGKIQQATFYFWDNTDNDDLYQQGSGYVNQNYAIYNASGIGTGICAPRFGTTGKKPNGIVKPGQGFIVQAASTADFLEVENSMRTSAVERNGDFAPYFKNGNAFAAEEISRINQFWVELINPDDLHFQTAVSYFEEAENTYDVYDSKILSENASENIYTLSKDEVKLAIQGREGNFDDDDVIPLGVKIFKAGKHKIQLEKIRGIFKSHQNIYLKDKILHTIHNLSENGSYDFEGTPGEFMDRFEIVFKADSAFSEADLTESTHQINILKRNRQIEIRSSSDKILEVEIYHLSGLSVYKNEKVNRNILRVPTTLFKNQIILVKVKTETGEIQTKKFVNK